MAEKFSFFDPIEIEQDVFDREYNAEEFTDYFKTLVTTGVMKGVGAELKVTANGSNMITEIDIGVAFVEGRYYSNTSKLAHTHDTEVLGKDRIDRIVVRLDLNTEARHVKSFVKKGIASATPAPPSLTRDSHVYEISLAQVKVIGGQTYISANNITDERGKDDICPWAGSKILPNFDNSSIGQPNGIATLDRDGDVPLNQLKKIPLPQDASTTQKGIVQLSDSTTEANRTKAATANAVNTLNSLINAINNNYLNANNIYIGNGSYALNTAIAIGQSAIVMGGSALPNPSGIAIGKSAIAYGDGIAIGSGARADTVAYGVALGTNARVNASLTVALGHNAVANNQNDATLGYQYNSWRVPGSFSVQGSKQFEIPHPHPDKKHTHVLRHGAVESPTAGDNLYRYTVDATKDGETVELQLPDYFVYLNKDVDVWVNPHLHFGRAFGIVEGNLLKVTCEKAGTYKVLVIGTRNDEHHAVQNWNIKGVERAVGESWTGETYMFEVDEIAEASEFGEGML